MIDLELFESILNQEEGYIEPGETLDDEFFTRMKKYNHNKVEKLFKKLKKENFAKGEKRIFALKLDCSCNKCGKNIKAEVSKSKVISVIAGEEELKCLDCVNQEKKEEEAKAKISRMTVEANKELIESQRLQKTKAYIADFLNPSNSWMKNLKNHEKISALEEIRYCYKEDVENYIMSMNYQEFLQTPYWKAIAEKVRIRSKYKCVLCDSKENLSIHHKTYKHHGKEIDNMSDLVCICKECHEKHHEIH